MTAKAREKFATQVPTETLSAMRRLAREEGRQIQTLVEEAFNDLIEKRGKEQPREHVIAAYRATHRKFGPLYKKLAE